MFRFNKGGQQWSTTRNAWGSVKLPTCAIQCGCCHFSIVEELDSIFYQREHPSKNRFCHAWCHLLRHVSAANLLLGNESDGMQRFQREVAHAIQKHEMMFPTMRAYQNFLTLLVHRELGDGPEAETLKALLLREKQYCVCYVQIAWACGQLATMDGLLYVYASIADYMHPQLKFSLLHVLDKRETLQKRWACRLIATMREVEAILRKREPNKKKGDEAVKAWLGSSAHCRSTSAAERQAYARIVELLFH